MALGLAKILGVIALGGGIVTPIVYSLPSTSQKFTKKLIGTTTPVLTCVGDNGKEGYELYLQLDENEKDLEQGLDLHVFKVKDGQKTEVKRKGESLGWTDFWFFWINFEGKESVQKVKPQKLNEQLTGNWITCKDSKIIAIKDQARNYPSQNIDLLHISFKVDKNCLPTDKQECNVNIWKSGDQLGWKTDFQPKIVYSAI